MKGKIHYEDRINTEQCNRLCRLHDVMDSIGKFSCGGADLDEFFRKDAIKYEQQLFGKTYCFRLRDSDGIVGLFTVSNASIQARQMRRSLRDTIAHPKRLVHNYPSVLIGRLAVAADHQDQKIGGEMLDFIKIWFSDPGNKTGCRFLAVDAYNDERILDFYKGNGFSFIFKNEAEETESLGIPGRAPLHTRMMCFDIYPLVLSRAAVPGE